MDISWILAWHVLAFWPLQDEQHQRVFSQLSAECARESVRRKAIDNFGPPRPVSSSRWAEVVRHPYFERMSLAMIYLNAVWIAIDIEFNKADMVLQAESPFLIMEIVFTLYFSGELFVRFMSYENAGKLCVIPGLFSTSCW